MHLHHAHIVTRSITGEINSSVVSTPICMMASVHFERFEGDVHRSITAVGDQPQTIVFFYHNTLAEAELADAQFTAELALLGDETLWDAMMKHVARLPELAA